MDRSVLEQLRPLGRYLRPHRKVLLVSLGLSVASTALGMIQPYFAKILVDSVFIGRRADLLVPLLAVLVGLLAAAFGIRVTNSYLYTRYSARLLFKMREDLFGHLHKLPIKIVSQRKIGDLHSRIASDMADVQALLTETIPNWLFDSLTFLMTLGILFWLQWKMALLCVCVLPVGVLVTQRLRPRLARLASAIATGNADISHFLFESLEGTTVVRSFEAIPLEAQKLETKHAGVLGSLLSYQVLGAVAGSVPIAFVIFTSLVVFGYGGMLVLQGSLTLGTLLAFALYQGRVLAPLQGVFTGVMAFQKAKVALSRVRELLDIPAEESVATQAETTIPDRELRGEIVFEKVSFSYEPGKPVLEGLSFCVPGGKVTALVGPSGVGKTTICHLAMRLLDPDSGTIFLDGIPLRNLRRDWLRRTVALISQDTFLFHTSILENIRFGRPEASSEEVVAAARAACIEEFIESLPRGYATEVGDRGVRLSGGQRQRISIARSLLIDPKVIIMDEAMAFLDAQVEERLKETLRRLMEKRTILIVSHHLSAIEGADRLVVVRGGKTVYQGPFDRSALSGIGGQDGSWAL
jgi:ATP-binding cassette subfamily B protein